MNSRRIEKNDLGSGRIPHALNRRARGLRLIGDDRDLAADQRIQQRGFPGVRAGR